MIENQGIAKKTNRNGNINFSICQNDLIIVSASADRFSRFELPFVDNGAQLFRILEHIIFGVFTRPNMGGQDFKIGLGRADAFKDFFAGGGIAQK